MDWMDLDIDSTIHDFEYTKRAAREMNRVLDSAEFADMDSDAIFSYLTGQMDIVLFPAYLKRYIYEKSEVEAPFKEIDDGLYLEVLNSSFVENRAPHSMKPTVKKRSAVLKTWFNQNTVRRNTIFLLGFGLRMPADDVSEFLTKVIKEEDFDFSDPDEVIFWYCYKNDLRFQHAQLLRQKYDEMTPVDLSEDKWQAFVQSPKMYLIDARNLERYLAALKVRKPHEKRAKASYDAFTALYKRGCETIAEMYNEDTAFLGEDRKYTAADIQPGDFEKVLCSGMPVNEDGNLEKLSASMFASLFQNMRMSRQRITSILKKQHPVERLDLITLLFLIYTRVEPDWPAERFIRYVDEINDILRNCHMMEIYPVNPYEAFVLMAIVSEYPLETYAEIWERSFQED